VHTEPAKGVSDEYKKLNKLGKVPTFEGADGYVLTECMAIAIYSKSRRVSCVTGKRWNLVAMMRDHYIQLSLSEDYC